MPLDGEIVYGRAMAPSTPFLATPDKSPRVPLLVQVPLDGEIVHGRAMVSSEHITGESLPVLRRSGDEVRPAVQPKGLTAALLVRKRVPGAFLLRQARVNPTFPTLHTLTGGRRLAEPGRRAGAARAAPC